MAATLAPGSLSLLGCDLPKTNSPSFKPRGGRGHVILHCDFDAFFCSVGLSSRPELKGRPVVVCHSAATGASTLNSTSEIARFVADASENPRVVVSSNTPLISPSYEARTYGIKAGMKFVCRSTIGPFT